jgi:hypothetical protein
MKLLVFLEDSVLTQRSQGKNVILIIYNISLIDLLIHQAYPCDSIIENPKAR